MPLRSWVRRLERRKREGLASFVLTDGSTYYYNSDEAYIDFILFCYDLGRGEEVEIPEVYRRLTEAADIHGALDELRPDRPDLAPNTIEGTFDIEHLLAHRELVVREEALVPAEDLSE